MARVDELAAKDIIRASVHEPVHATFHVFEEAGATYLQIDTYGSSSRAVPSKVSQSLQFGPEGIAALRKILARLP